MVELRGPHPRGGRRRPARSGRPRSPATARSSPTARTSPTDASASSSASTCRPSPRPRSPRLASSPAADADVTDPSRLGRCRGRRAGPGWGHARSRLLRPQGHLRQLHPQAEPRGQQHPGPRRRQRGDHAQARRRGVRDPVRRPRHRDRRLPRHDASTAGPATSGRELYPGILASDILVVAGPIWLGDNSSQTKKLIERHLRAVRRDSTTRASTSSTVGSPAASSPATRTASSTARRTSSTASSTSATRSRRTPTPAGSARPARVRRTSTRAAAAPRTTSPTATPRS